jgi:predicted nucleic acid-binding protein
MKVLFDTNILVYSYNSNSPFNQIAKNLFESLDDIFITQQNLLEFYSIITNPKRIELPVSHEEALGVLTEYSKSNILTVLSPNIQTLTRAW